MPPMATQGMRVPLIEEVTPKRRGRPLGGKNKPNPVIEARNQQIKEMYLSSMTLESVGKVFGLTRERIRQILVSLGVESFDGGAAVRWEAQRLARHEAREAACQAKYGCSLEQYKALRRQSRSEHAAGVPYDRTPIGAYRNRKNCCNTHNIEFDLTLWEFWTIWQESGHWHDRGQGKYGLCRKDTSKGFTKDNVFIRKMGRESGWGEKLGGVASRFKPVR